MLADSKITPAEYEEANQRWLACMQGTYPVGGKIKVRLRRDSQGVYGSEVLGFPDGQPDDVYDQTSDACTKGTTDIISPLFNDMKTNPKHMSAEGQISDCLKRHGLVQGSYAEGNLRADLARQSAAQGAPSTPAGVDMSKATSLNMDDSSVQHCISNPGE